MRLINADAIEYTMTELVSFLKNFVWKEEIAMKKEIDAMPTVDAIPIEWIENWMYGLHFGVSDVVCKKMIKDWRKEE